MADGRGDRERGGRPVPGSQQPTGGDKANATRKQYFRRKKVCRFCVEKVDDINYKDVRMLSSFLTERAKIIQPQAPSVRSLEVILLARTGQEGKALALARQGGATWKSFSEKMSISSARAARW